MLYRGGFYTGGPILTSALSGIEQALWDIKGKRFGVPIYEVLGRPVREKVRVYAWIGGASPAVVGAAAKARVQEGYSALKMHATASRNWIDSPSKVQAAVATLAEVREAIAYGVDIAIDFHGRVHRPAARFLYAQRLGIHSHQNAQFLDPLVDPGVFHYQDGFVPRLANPGLGIEIHEEKVREKSLTGHHWQNPVWRNADGSVAEWSCRVW